MKSQMMKDGIEIWILCTATRIWRMVGHTGRRRKLRSPDGTLAARIHRRIGRTVVGVGELLRVGERTQHPDGTRRVDRRPDLGQCVLGSHRSAPNLRVVQEE